MKKSGELKRPAKNISNMHVIDEAGKESFPSSDPPAWTLGSDQELLAPDLKKSQDVQHALLYEHLLMRHVLRGLEKTIFELKSGKTIDTKTLKSIVSFLVIFVDYYHEKKEELTFDLMRESKERPSDYLLNDLKHEHGHSKLLHRDLKEALVHYEQHPLREREHLIRLLKSIVHLHHTHTAKEEEYVFPLINLGLDKAQQEKLLQTFKSIEHENKDIAYDDLLRFAEQLKVK